MKGAEAILTKTRVLGFPAVEKFRPKKGYRAPALDEKIRRERTRREARLLSRAKKAGVLCPVVYEVSDFAIRMKFLEGMMLHHALRRRAIKPSEIASAARILSALHKAGIVHGDFTPANLMGTPQGMAVIDFGLGSISSDDEDKGTDIVTMKKALGGKKGGAFEAAYLRAGGKPSVARMAEEIGKRG
ncbi:MAG: KEOPS complex kinase/ATPase Bud32, partial [Candidatus Micrarchaeia archaeon]